MRALPLSLSGTAILALLVGLCGAVMAEGESQTTPGAVALTADTDYGALIKPATLEYGDDAIFHDGVVSSGKINEPSDSRFSGTWTSTRNGLQYPDPGGFMVWHQTYRIENEDGAWQGTPTIWLTSRGSRDPQPVTSVFTGEGAYEGWMVVAEIRREATGYVFDGVMYEGRIPPPPDPTVDLPTG